MFLLRYIKILRQSFKNVKRSSKIGEDFYLKQSFNDETEHKFSLYGRKKVKDAAKTHHWIHYVFKYKILMPVFYALEKGFQKYFYEPTEEWYDEMYNDINTSVERGTYKWAKYCMGINKNWSEKDIKNYIKKSPFMRMFRLGQFGIVGNDSVYKELENMIFHEFGKIYIEKYGNKENLNHLMYTGQKIYDINYYYSGYDLLNRYFIKSDMNGEEKIIATKSLPLGHEKVYFTVDVKGGWKNIFKQMQENINKIPNNYMVTGFNLAAMGINNMEVEVFNQKVEVKNE